MSSRTARVRLAAGGLAIVTLSSLGGVVSVPAHASRPGPAAALPGRYIVTLQDSVADPRTVAGRQAKRLRGNVERVFGTAFKGYSASLLGADLSSLLADPLVKAVEPDVQVTLSATQLNPPSGLDRIDQRSLPLSRSYSSATNGQGVKAYVIDSGIRREHPAFAGRVAQGVNVVNWNTDTSDCNGHGTHVAGTLAGSAYGVAKGALIVPVKTFGCSDNTSLSAIVAGVDWATANHLRGQPAVANLSLTLAGASAALDRAITALSNDGVAVAVAAGNSGADACNISPGRVPQVLTVASSDAGDAMASFSNGGPCIDVFAPGVRIVSADNRSNGSAVMSGTSMSSPHVAGALALEMSRRGTTPQQAQNNVLARATFGKITGTGPRCNTSSSCRPATPANRLLFIV